MQLVVARLGRPHGIRGDVTVEVRTDEPDERMMAGSVLETDPADAGPLAIDNAFWHSGRLILHFKDVPDRSAAEELRGIFLVVNSEDLPDLDDPDEFRDHDLVGLAAVDPAGASIGTLTAVDHGPGGDMLIVTAGDGRKHLIPFVKAIVTAIDATARTITIDAPEGLFDL
ncbi:ribosome maturation factor RimM [Fodinicola feengrottensis]|uniref:ribosome maturation factor RimM n=1 Tax=Fodinicola feengrottensis TaxID=435914 RepID=UPI0031DDF759